MRQEKNSEKKRTVGRDIWYPEYKCENSKGRGKPWNWVWNRFWFRWKHLNENKYYKKRGKEMKQRNFVIKPDEMEVVDGKVVISSEELAAAIQNGEVDLNAEEKAEALIEINRSCPR